MQLKLFERLNSKMCLTRKIGKRNREKAAVPHQLPEWAHSSYFIFCPWQPVKAEQMSLTQRKGGVCWLQGNKGNVKGNKLYVRKAPVSWHLLERCAWMSFCKVINKCSCPRTVTVSIWIYIHTNSIALLLFRTFAIYANAITKTLSWSAVLTSPP